MKRNNASRLGFALAAAVAAVVPQAFAADRVVIGWNTTNISSGATSGASRPAFGTSPSGSNYLSTLMNPNIVTTGGMVQGSGVTTNYGDPTKAGPSYAFGAPGGVFGGFDWEDMTAASAITNGRYLTFDVAPVSGYSTSLSTITGNWRRSNAQSPDKFLWQYSTDGTTFTNIPFSDLITGSAATTFSDIGAGDGEFSIPWSTDLTQNRTTNTLSGILTYSGNGGAMPAVNLKLIPALQGITTTDVTFRLVAWDGLVDPRPNPLDNNTYDTASWGFGRAHNPDDLEVLGSILNLNARNLQWVSNTTGTWTFTGTQTFTNTAGTPGNTTLYTDGDNATFSGATGGTITVDANGVSPTNLVISNTAGIYTFTGGSIGGSNSPGAATFVQKTGAGTLVLATANTFTGGLEIDAGTVQVPFDSALGDGAGTVFLGGGKLAYTGFTSGGSQRAIQLTAATSSIIELNGNTVQINTLGGSGNVTIQSTTGSGTGTLRAVGGYTGAGIITVASPSAALEVDSSSSFNNSMVLNGSLNVVSGPFIAFNSGTVTGTGTIFFDSAASQIEAFGGGQPGGTINVPVVFNALNLPVPYTAQIEADGGYLTGFMTLTFNAPISGAADLVFKGSFSSGNVVLNAQNTYTGSPGDANPLTIINNTPGSFVKIGIDNALPPSTVLQFGDASNFTIGSFDLNGHNQSVNQLTVVTTSKVDGITNTSSTLGTLTITGTSVSDIRAALTGNLALHVTGTGQVDINYSVVSNTYSGGSTIDPGSAVRVGFETISTSASTTFTSAGSLGTGAVTNNGSLTLATVHIGTGSVGPDGAGALTVPAIDGTGITIIGDPTNLFVTNVTATHIRQSMLDVTAGSSVIIAKTVPPVPPASYTTGLSVIQTFTFDAGSSLDLTNHSLIVPSGGTTLGTIQSDVSSGLITSSLAGAGTALKVWTASAYETISGKSTFQGYTLAGNETIVMYDFTGDANLDGAITINDYARIDSAFLLGTPSPTWINGDFNGDGKVDYQDYALIDAGFAASQNNSLFLASEISSHFAEFGAPYLAALNADLAPVPEPASLGLLGFGIMVMARRRSRR